jgi:hypothetical protein
MSDEKCRTCGLEKHIDAQLRGARERARILELALKNAVMRGWQCGGLDKCSGCDSECYQKQLQIQCNVYFDEAEAELNHIAESSKMDRDSQL